MTDLIGQRLGEFEVLSVLGRGGMGVVYEAVQTSLNRRVALKVLGAGLGLTPQAVDRFKREAEAAARLHHTNIVPVYATGEQGGTHFYAMELIHGPSLDAVVRQLRERQAAPARTVPADLAATGPYVAPDPLPPAPGTAPGSGSAADRFDRVAAIVADAADALHHAHRSGVTHRDVKPSNLLLAADGRVRVTDFGLARMLEQPGVTVTGEFVGTPAYMSPEQITAGRVLVDHRTDVYSLGATLYELLTLRPPFVADGRDRLLAMVIQKDPPSVRSLDPKVPKDLETICLKALDKDPDRRYQSAGAMAEDLRRYLNRFAILAKRTGPLTRAVKWARRNPAVAGLIAVALVVAGVVGVFAYEQRQQAERQQAEEARHAEELRAEKLRGVMDRVLTATLAGRVKDADTGIEEAERLGASTADVHRLRGQIALIRIDYPAAVRELTQALALRPDGVAEAALLAVAHFKAGNEPEFAALINQLEGRTPRTAEDQLYFGWALAIWDPARGLPFMQTAIELRDGAIPRFVRGETLGQLGFVTENLELCEKGLTDLRIARGLLGNNNRSVVMSCLKANLWSGLVCEVTGRPEKVREHWDRAEADARILERFPDDPLAVYARCTHLRVTGRDETALLLSGRKYREFTLIPTDYAVFAYRLGSPDALRIANDWLDEYEANFPTVPYSLICRMYLLSELGEADRAKVITEYERYTRTFTDPTSEMFAIGALLLCGRADDARSALLKLNVQAFPQSIRKPYTAIRDHIAGHGVSEAEVMAAAQTDRAIRCEACFFLGLARLAAGDRSNAMRLFRDGAVRYRCPDFIATPWCMALLARMEKDPTWPAWIPGKK